LLQVGDLLDIDLAGEMTSHRSAEPFIGAEDPAGQCPPADERFLGRRQSNADSRPSRTDSTTPRTSWGIGALPRIAC
jgi:hypothetical protein